MIVINNKLAKQAVANAIDSGRVGDKSSPHAFLLQALVHLNFVFDVKRDPSLFLPRDFSLDAWSTTEIAAADAVNWLIAFLDRMGCSDIERLLKDVAAYRERHPDRPKGAWPYEIERQ